MLHLSFRLKLALLIGLLIGLVPTGVWALNQTITSNPPQARRAIVHPEAAAFDQLAQAHNGEKFDLPGGCVTLAGQQACVPTVILDSQRMPDIVVLSKLVGVSGEPGAPSTSLSSPQNIQSAVAAAVFERLLYVQGRQDGFSVAASVVKAFAQQELANYLSDPLPAAIPAGTAPQAYFLSPNVMAVYGHGMIVADERQKITAAAAVSADPTPAYREWLGTELTRHTITVDGAAPTFSLPNALPERP